MNLKKIKCVILDFDNTMYSDGDWSHEDECFGGFLVEQNLLPELGDWRERLNFLYKKYPQYHLLQFMFAFLHDSGIDDSAFRKYNNENICEIRGENTIFINPQIIDELAKNYKVYIISDSSVPYLEFYLKHAKISKKNFQAILSNEYNDEGYTKIPMMKKVLQETGLKPGEIIMVGDSEKADITPAKLVGFQTYLVDHVSDTEKILQDLINLKNPQTK